MTVIPTALKKMQEAQIFLSKLSRHHRENLALDVEDFEFYLSAFLSAGRSITWATFHDHTDGKAAYNTWHDGLRQSSRSDDYQLTIDMHDVRAKEVHHSGAEYQVDLEWIPIIQKSCDRLHPTYGVHIAQLPGMPQPQEAVKVNRFMNGGSPQDVTETCTRYLDFLKEFFEVFDRAHPDF